MIIPVQMLMCDKVTNNNFDGQFHYSVQKNKCRHYRLMPALILLLMKQYLYWS